MRTQTTAIYRPRNGALSADWLEGIERIVRHVAQSDLITPEEMAKAAAVAIQRAEEAREELRIQQAAIAIWVYESDIWRAHPDRPNTFWQFLRSCGLSESSASYLSALATEIAPATQRWGIPIDDILNHWHKVQEALPAFREAVRENDPNRFAQITRVVVDAPDRTTVRNAFRAPRKDPCPGSIARDRDGWVITIRVPTQDALDRIVRRLGNLVRWE